MLTKASGGEQGPQVGAPPMRGAGIGTIRRLPHHCSTPNVQQLLGHMVPRFFAGTALALVCAVGLAAPQGATAPSPTQVHIHALLLLRYVPTEETQGWAVAAAQPGDSRPFNPATPPSLLRHTRTPPAPAVPRLIEWLERGLDGGVQWERGHGHRGVLHQRHAGHLGLQWGPGQCRELECDPGVCSGVRVCPCGTVFVRGCPSGLTTPSCVELLGRCRRAWSGDWLA
jgi:hypothetical protein